MEEGEESRSLEEGSGADDQSEMDGRAAIAVLLYRDAAQLGQVWLTQRLVELVVAAASSAPPLCVCPQDFDDDSYPAAKSAIIKYSQLVKDLLIKLCGAEEFDHVEFLEVEGSYKVRGLLRCCL